uniref:P0 n=1 Tax=Potato leafroll virus TaxID=12045 RepID=A0A8F8QS27_PLRV|nr:P0 [Potato leafroll virus]
MIVLTQSGTLLFDQRFKLSKFLFVVIATGFPLLLQQASLIYGYNHEQIYRICRSFLYVLPLLNCKRGRISTSGLQLPRHLHYECLEWGLLCGTHPAIQIVGPTIVIKLDDPTTAAAYRSELLRVSSSSYIQNAAGLSNGWGHDMEAFVRNAICLLELRERSIPQSGLRDLMGNYQHLVRSILDACEVDHFVPMDFQHRSLMLNFARLYNQLDLQGRAKSFRALTGFPVYVPSEDYLEGSFLQKELQE